MPMFLPVNFDAQNHVLALKVQRKLQDLAERYAQWQGAAAKLQAELEQEVAQDRLDQANTIATTETVKFADRIKRISPEQRAKLGPQFRRMAQSDAIMSEIEQQWTPEQQKRFGRKLEEYILANNVKENFGVIRTTVLFLNRCYIFLLIPY